MAIIILSFRDAFPEHSSCSIERHQIIAMEKSEQESSSPLHELYRYELAAIARKAGVSRAGSLKKAELVEQLIELGYEAEQPTTQVDTNEPSWWQKDWQWGVAGIVATIVVGVVSLIAGVGIPANQRDPDEIAILDPPILAGDRVYTTQHPREILATIASIEADELDRRTFAETKYVGTWVRVRGTIMSRKGSPRQPVFVIACGAREAGTLHFECSSEELDNSGHRPAIGDKVELEGQIRKIELQGNRVIRLGNSHVIPPLEHVENLAALVAELERLRHEHQEALVKIQQLQRERQSFQELVGEQVVDAVQEEMERLKRSEPLIEGERND